MLYKRDLKMGLSKLHDNDGLFIDVNNQGVAVVRFHLEGFEGSHYGRLGGKRAFCVINIEGGIDQIQTIRTNGLINGEEIKSLSLLSKIVGDKYFIGGYADVNHGVVSAVYNISFVGQKRSLLYRPFSKRLLAVHWAKDLDHIPQARAKNEKRARMTCSENLRLNSMVIAENEDIVLVGEALEPFSPHLFEDIIVSRISASGDIVFEKNIIMDQKLIQPYRIQRALQGAFIVNDCVKLFVNSERMKVIDGPKMDDYKKDASGVVISINPDGTQWEKYPYEFSKPIKKGKVLSFWGVKLSDSTLLMPVELNGYRDLGYVKFIFD